LAGAHTRGMSGETKPDDATVINDAVDALTNLSVGDAAAGGDAGAAAGGSTAEGGGGAREEQQQQKPLKPLTDEQVDKIVKQVEFYFSDANLPTDAFLIKKVKADPTGFVPIGVVCSFNRMKTLLKKHPPIETVAAILREHSECLVVSDDGIRVRRTEPLPDIDLEDVQARTVVAENFKDQPTIESVMAQFSAAGDVAMVRVRHPGMQTQAGATKPSGLDLIATPSNAVHALIEFKTREDATKAAETLNDDKDWRNGLRVRLLVRNVHKKQKQQKQQRQKLDDEHAAAAGEEGAGEGAGEGGNEGDDAEGDAAAAPKKNKKKGKWGRQKKDYSQWASAAAFKENKTFLEAGGDGDTGGDGGGEGGGDAKDGSGEAKGSEERRRHGTFHATAADPDAPRQPTMPNGTRGFQPGVGRGKRMPPPHPK